MTAPLDLPALEQLVGRVVVGVRRVLYVLRGLNTSTAGPIELTFAGGSAVVLDAGSDGEALAVSTRRWIDPFAPPLSPENQRYVETSGKWTAFDVSDQEPYAALVGATVDSVEPILTSRGKLIGASIRAGATVLRAKVEADELSVDVN